jgi:4-amino-4-deoxy-L-arabinose transferase-like glycosyltransferase
MKFLKTNVVILSILLLAFVLRFYHLSTNPPGLYWDEASLGYNAYSILKTGKDEYSKFLPTIFRSYGDYKAPVYFYALIPSIVFFDLTDFAVRFPSALGGTLSVLLLYFISKKLTLNTKTALFSAFFLTISPWHLQFSRAGFEANFKLFLTLLGLVLFFKFPRKFSALILSAIIFGLSLHTYQGAKVLTPLLLLALFIFYKEQILYFGKKLIIPIVVGLIFVLPIALNLNQSLIRGKSVSIFSNHDNTIYNNFTSGYLSHFSAAFLFIRGDSIGRHSVPGVGELYVFQLPLLLIGLFTTIKKKTKESKFLLSWMIITPLAAALSTPTPHALRALSLAPVLSIICAEGTLRLSKAKISPILPKAKVLALSLLFLIGAYNFLLYLHLYHVHYPKQNGPDWQDGYRETFTYVSQIHQNYQKVIISDALGFPYIYTLFYLKFDPRQYQLAAGNKRKFDKFNFFQGYWQGQLESKTLYVTSPAEGHPNNVLKQIRNHNGDLVFTISDNQ